MSVWPISVITVIVVVGGGGVDDGVDVLFLLAGRDTYILFLF